MTGHGRTTLPWCSWSGADGVRRVGVGVDDAVLDAARVLPHRAELFEGGTLDGLLASGSATWEAVRAELQEVVAGDPADLVPVADVTLHLPWTVGDYVDFYASEQHATNLGRMFRPDSEPLTPNWKHLPIGYHGRSGTVVVSGTDVRRPEGQRRLPDGQVVMGPSLRLDIEAEVGFVVGGEARRGPVPLDAAEQHLFGVVLVNDWSARDLQAWEYVPLGPFLGKSFATSVSAWVVPWAALEHARVAPPVRDVPLLRYLDDGGLPPGGLDLQLEVRLGGEVLSRPPYASMYWTPAQMLAHLSVNGASVRPGDLFASGTVSGSERDERGSLIEMSWNGTEPIHLADGTVRTFLEDGDTVTISATAGDVWLGEVTGTIVGS